MEWTTLSTKRPPPVRPRPASVDSRGRLGGDRAVSEVVGSLLMAAITVGMAVTFGHALVGQVPSEAGPPPVGVQTSLDAGSSGWADGDEQVLLQAESGVALFRNNTIVHVTVGSDGEQTYEGAALEGGFADGAFTIGEIWEANLSIPPSTTVSVQVVDAAGGWVVASAQLVSGTRDCSTDTEAPYADVVTQKPEDLDATTIGSIDVTVTAEDACAGVDATTTPNLEYRFGDGSSFTDAGAMDHLGGATWQGSISEPTDGWEAYAGQTLVYRVNPLTDLANNSAPSSNQSEPIEADDALGGNLTYVTDYVTFSGTVTDFPAAQNASDDGNAAVFEENETSPNASTSEAYGTAYSSSSGLTDPGAATGSPDDDHARSDAKGEWLGIEGFQTFSGEIQKVELALQAHYDGTTNGDADELELSYRLGTQPGITRASYTPADLNEASDGPTKYLNVTGDRAWSWSDVDELQVRSEYKRNGPGDDLAYDVDSLWVRVTYDNPAYNMSIRADVENLPTGSHDLELRYAVSDETHHLQTWNFTAASWEQAEALTSSSLQELTVPLGSDEVSSGETRFRLVDDVRDPGPQSTVDLDYARVRTR